ncbi:hypothetical protein TVAG_216420 [Trichomonas vaginalis G3]|uniref:Uncharacterized protein n=1 Tax=Trichomonas vaginalis (strain ATCC PRA-98 / G3) TaxID=412133 RepID=A2ENX6_TRIV3|nr:hypothetical protein TVAGG3_0249610 [Trichomonas vaginalis G3]EAY05666.1 hypothetical protein TVAG_216420 [Trichomonas vaginalis G3]KAI5553906.1 hypothetical protein TVAGG3_0249610 [Trichomonas vaginalis G3]|eukprot:XP_001317889.1 hypothetical protein [Trichomonas vaginalis G3]
MIEEENGGPPSNAPFLVQMYNIKEPNYTPKQPDEFKREEKNNSELSNHSKGSQLDKRAPRNYQNLEPAKTRQRRRRRKQDFNPLEFMLDENSSKASKIATKLLFGGVIDEEVTPDIFTIVIKDLEHRRDVFMLKGAFPESLKASEAIDMAKQLQINAIKKQTQEYELADVNLRQGHMETDAAIFNHISRAEFNEIREKNKKIIERMRERHKRELEEHERKWKDDKMQRNYNHRSAKLQELYSLERRLHAVGRTEEANTIKKQAEQLEAIEYEASRQRFETDYRESRDLLLKKQADELDTYKKANEVRKQVFRNKYQNGKRTISNRRAMLKHQEEIAKDPDRVWRLRHRGERDTVVTGARREGVKNLPPISPILLPPLEEKKSSRKQ